MKLILHAPTEASIGRARESAVSFNQHNEDAGIVIVANDEAVRVAIEVPDPQTDRWLVVCEQSLLRLGLDCRAGLATTAEAAFLIARLQRKGWSYMRS